MTKPNLSDYINAAQNLTEHLASLPPHLNPIYIGQFGKVKNPGISDLDLIVAVPDDFLYGDKLNSKISQFVNTNEYKHILFQHLPVIYPISIAKHIGNFFYVDTNEINNLYGSIDFSEFKITLQHVLQQLEFLSERLVHFMICQNTPNYPVDKLLVTGHSLIHSIDVLNRFEPIDTHKFKGIDIVEKTREISNSIADFQVPIKTSALAELLAHEATELLWSAVNIIESHINMFIGSNQKSFHHSPNIFYTDFVQMSESITIKRSGDILLIEGLPELCSIIKTCFFDDPNSFQLLCSKDLEVNLKSRRRMIHQLGYFNLMNFGHGFGRSGLTPFLTDIYLSKALLDYRRHYS